MSYNRYYYSILRSIFRIQYALFYIQQIKEVLYQFSLLESPVVWPLLYGATQARLLESPRSNNYIDRLFC